ncbi:MAG: hypothetical protein MZW92_24300 [Comamonadaceae bacterium]|nr:hypothetical protein [Comamonadaceae bacterium]
MNYRQNFPKFFVSLHEGLVRRRRDARRTTSAYDWLPKRDERLRRAGGRSSACTRARSTASSARASTRSPRCPNKAKVGAALSKLKYLVVIDPLATETSRVLEELRRVQRRRPGEDPDRGLPPAVHLLRRGGRLAHQHRAAGCSGTGRRAEPPGEAKTDVEIIGGLFHAAARRCTSKEGGSLPGSDPQARPGRYAQPDAPVAGGAARGDQRQGAGRRRRPEGPDQGPRPRRASSWPASPSCSDDGSTACGCWIYAGGWTQAGNLMARRDTADPTGLGNTLSWAWSLAGQPAHPLQPRLGRPGRQALGPEARWHLLERQGLGGRRRPGHRGRRRARSRAWARSS